MWILIRKYSKLVIVTAIILIVGLITLNRNRYNFHRQNSKLGPIESKRTLIYYQPNSTWNSRSTNVTVVTAYFDLGTFRKGQPGNYFTTHMYYDWARIFRHIKNPLVIFTDSDKFKLHMKTIRNESFMSTKIILLNRSSSWAFQNIDKIRKIFGSSQYPKHYPNTVVPAYACAQHAKYDMVERAAKMNVFNTDYYMWIDIGYLRNRKSHNKFYLARPPGFNDSKIAFNLINTKLGFDQQPDTIMKQNLVLLGGGLFFGDRNHVIAFAAQFKKAVEFFLSERLSNTDQQILYAMFSKIGRGYLKPKVGLQIYKPPRDNNWFYLGTLMIQESKHI